MSADTPETAEAPPPVSEEAKGALMMGAYYEAVTELNLQALLHTGRVEPGPIALRAATFMTCALSLRYPVPLFKGTQRITAKTLRREKARVLRWVREHNPDLAARAEAKLREAGGGE